MSLLNDIAEELLAASDVLMTVPLGLTKEQAEAALGKSINLPETPFRKAVAFARAGRKRKADEALMQEVIDLVRFKHPQMGGRCRYEGGRLRLELYPKGKPIVEGISEWR